ncbi:hypothetical protein ATE92_0540 [Ulvibacter sp. MAR_2010_11]|nr:hypothetical protein ATE92_0540 [Ulvibacter sp. MAR_2010_11]
MIITPFSVIIATILSIGAISFYFFQKNKKITTLHLQHIRALEHEVTQHQKHIKFRSNGLDTYHFLKYNLEEALVVQPDIKI